MDPMFSSNRAGLRWFLVTLTVFALPLQSSVCFARGFAGIALDTMAPNRTPYTYVFSGWVTCQNKPCANARVDLDLVTTTQGAIARSTRTGEDGHYQLAITVAGAPEDSSLWKLEVRTAGLSGQESAQAEGSIILMEDEQTVVVDRSLLLTQA